MKRMSSLTGKLKVGMVVVALASTLPLLAGEPSTESVLITKMQNVLARLPKDDPSRRDIMLRLADLYAERARLDSMAELEKGCTQCEAGTPDRRQAIALYEQILQVNSDVDKGVITTQLGHLYELVGEKKKAIEAYTVIIKSSQDPLAIAEAELSMGEIYFRQGDFRNAIPHYEKVIPIDKATGAGLAAYRRAWCFFNLGDDQKSSAAMIEILKSPRLLTRGMAPGVVKPDEEFQAEVSRDLATFFGRQTITLAQAQLLFELSPKSAARSNTAYLAKELERMGKISPAIEVWRFVLSQDTSPKERLTGLTLMAQMEMNSQLADQGIKDYHQALETWTATPDCQKPDDAVCAEIKSRLKNFLVNWNKVEKEKSNPALLATYQGYLKIFTNDPDMHLFAGLVAKGQKQFVEAETLFARASQLFASAETAAAQDAKARKEAHDKMEVSLLSQIEAAEQSKDKSLMRKAYAQFLAMSKDEVHKFQVQYQLAYMIYESGEYPQAAEALRALALVPGLQNQKIKRQAADLALDTLVLLKDDARIEQWAGEFSSVFKDGAQEFAKATRAAQLNQAVSLAQSSGDQAQLDAAWAKMAKVNLDGASDADKARTYRNRALLAEKMNKWDEVESSAKAILALKDLTDEDREFAAGKVVWVSELKLDFGQALSFSEKMKMAGLSPTDRQLRLAMFADLAEKDSRPYLQQYLKVSQDPSRDSAIASRLVTTSPEPEKDLGRFEKVLARDAEVLARTYLEVVAAKPSDKLIAKVAKDGKLAETPSGKVLKRQYILGRVSKSMAELQGHQIDVKSQAAMGKTLKARIKMLGDWEKLTAEALEAKDWLAQAATLQVLAVESKRLYDNILALPMPAGLSDDEQRQYLELLGQQAAPHQERAQEAGAKAQEFWSNGAVAQQVPAMVKAESGAVRALLRSQVEIVAAVAPDTLRAQWQSEIGSPQAQNESGVANSAVVKARNDLRADPMNSEKLKLLLEVEKQSGNAVMVTYLEGRLAKGASSSAAPSAGQGGK